jgi:two-component system, cell cycle sensor histidine kinase and response regulator CckA
MEPQHHNGQSSGAVQPLPTAERAAEIESALMRLARLSGASGASLREVWLEVASLAARTMDVDRVGAWMLIDEGRALRCRYMFQRSSREIFQGAVLRAQDFPLYFQAMQERRTIAADDAIGSPLTGELRNSYLEPLGITSMLDAPIYLDGQIVGVVCHEHVGPPRCWSEADCAFASAVADNISRLYGEHERRHAESALESYQRHLMELHRMEAVGRMAAGVAHDFRGVVGIALGFAELIRRVPELPPQADHYAQRVVEALERGRQMTEEIVRYGKDDPVSPIVLDVNAAIMTTANMLRVLLGSNVRLKLATDRTVSRVFVDPAQLERALLNLVLNARDAMPDGGELHIAVEDVVIQDDGEGATYVAITVTDSGCGMDENTRADAFKPFFTTKGERGTGLGLVIVDQIVARAGGRVTLDSAPGRGTTVRMHLPRIAGAAG